MRAFFFRDHSSLSAPSLVISTPLPLSRRCELRLPAMCDAGEDAPAAEEEPPAASVLDDLSGVPAEVLETVKGLTLLEAAALIKEVDATFKVGDYKEEDEEAAEPVAAE
ncbi:hypothetical protein EMIHUDRAFT_251065 [Emiliania huxleyi CCMP1516]|uniref:Ribosomal protein L7/L12 oligomerisation domain-containing protein n=2 Tax=Emiliania huxleyi TaxID=2903 RepID=A0A0D3KXZ9_EMIH1|nr:hypothetical protein EMIHUDRAFT_251065 [Emiliania huxleyi CCMP1516]EOD40634.1 hypothetical protein EMIHUDRAFT_251065 [Emiliania huxleyi CCMP1516]|eukprot:XP_005793063.1 hypothetical protein EMIHUDRAFT_251065 [Emiliania huxleyi CCMP1516]